MRRLLLVLLTVAIVAATAGLVSADNESDTTWDGYDVHPRKGVYEGKSIFGAKFSFVVGDAKRENSNTDEAIYKFMLGNQGYKTSETSIFRRRYAIGRLLQRRALWETFFASCEVGPVEQIERCVSGRWVTDEFVVGALSGGTRTDGFVAEWVRPLD